MKVLVLTTTFARRKKDVIPSFIDDLSKSLQKKGVEVIVVAPHHIGAKRNESMDGMKIYRFPYFFPAKYQKLAYGGGIPSNLKRSNLAKIQVPLFFLSKLYYTYKVVRREKIDIIHSHWIVPSGLAGAVCNRFLKVRHILTVHAAGLLFLKRLPFREKITYFILRHCDKITVVSSYIYRELLKLIPKKYINDIKNKTEIISMGIDVSLFRADFDKDELKRKYQVNSKDTLLFIGRLVEKKGVFYLIEAMKKIVSENSDTELIVCGDGPLREELEVSVKRNNLENFVRFVGYVNGIKKREYLFLSEILIVPSIVTESGDTEGLPVVILEGLAAGIPIIASNVGGISDVIKHNENGFLVKEKNPKGIAEKVLILLRDKELQHRFTQNALVMAEQYDWHTIGDRFYQVYAAVLGLISKDNER